ncbi:hypothetical protein [Cupriavidus malaysiensis]|nr:hypothetical protein [Cupriavidus malaysiensis]
MQFAEPQTLRSAHPVAPEVRARFMAELENVERHHGVKIPRRCCSGI